MKPSFMIKYSGVDGYLFLRYLCIVSSFGLGGMLIWIILLPVNATGGNHETGLNQLGISNVGNVGRYYAHVFMSWIYYAAIMFTVYRELHFYKLEILVVEYTTLCQETQFQGRCLPNNPRPVPQ